MDSKRNSVFRDISALDFDYQPPESPIRKKELQKLLATFDPVLISNSPQFALIHGAVGTGKKTLVKRFYMIFREYALEYDKNFQFLFVNCRHRNTDSAMMLKILSHFQPYFSDKGFSIDEMMECLIRDPKKQKVHLILVLDEADVLINKSGSDLIYKFLTFNKEGGNAKNLLSLILNSQINVMDLLNSPSHNLFKRDNIIHLNKFTREEILAVLNQRVKSAFHQDAAEIGVAELISDIASEWGDVRYGIELLEKAGMLADENNEQKVTVEHVRMTKAETYATITEDKLKALDLHQKLILLTVTRCLREEAYRTIDEVKKSYDEICKEFGDEKLVYSKFLEGINELGMCGIICVKEVKGEDPDRIIISLCDIPAVVLEGKMLDFIAK